jgi:hypothetical protein
VYATALTTVDLGGGFQDTGPVKIEDAQKVSLFTSNVRLKLPQGFITHKKVNVHRAVIAPEAHALARSIIGPAGIGKGYCPWGSLRCPGQSGKPAHYLPDFSGFFPVRVEFAWKPLAASGEGVLPDLTLFLSAFGFFDSLLPLRSPLGIFLSLEESGRSSRARTSCAHDLKFGGFHRQHFNRRRVRSKARNENVSGYAAIHRKG